MPTSIFQRAVLLFSNACPLSPAYHTDCTQQVPTLLFPWTETTIQRLQLPPLESKPGHVTVCLPDCISSFQFDHTQHLPLQTVLITLLYFLHISGN